SLVAFGYFPQRTQGRLDDEQCNQGIGDAPAMAKIAIRTFCLKTASTRASMHQDTASSVEPAARANVPSDVPDRPRSKIIRASIGNAVTAIAAPRKSMASQTGR